MPDPIGSQFGIAVDEVTYGAELRDALQSMAERWDLDDMRMFVVSLSVQSETGGNLAEILENLSQVIRERHAMLMKVRALSSEGRMTAVDADRPAGLHLRGAVHVQPATSSWMSRTIPGSCRDSSVLIILYVIGFVWIRQLVDLKV